MTRHIQIGEIQIDGDISNHFSGVNVPTDSTENIIKACDLLGIEAFAIYDNNKLLYTSERLRRHEDNLMAEKALHNANMLKRLEEFQRLPIVIRKWAFKTRIVQLERNADPKYDPSTSSGIIASLSFKIQRIDIKGMPEPRTDTEFNIENLYIGTKFQRKKFFNLIVYDKLKDSISIQEVEEIASKIPEMLEAKEGISSKYNIRRC